MSVLKKAVPGQLPSALAHHPDLNAAGMDGTVLATIVAAAFQRYPSAPLTPRVVREVRAERRPRSGIFERSLRHPGRRFILEVKAASPSEGRMAATIDTDQYARTYSRFADAVSVLTEPDFFDGSFERLAAMREKTMLPLLAKDFFVTEAQVAEAARAGADAVLLMLSVLSDTGYRKLAALAEDLGLEILTEADTLEDLKRAERLGARIIGINNRNLRTLTVDCRRVERLKGAAPKNALVVAESGYRTLAAVQTSGAEAFLCGSAVAKASDVSVGVRELLYGHSKVCGITRTEDAVAAVKAGATSIGLITAARSPRFIALSEARTLVPAVREATRAAGLSAEVVVVTDAVEVTSDFLTLVHETVPDVIQLHGALDDILGAAQRLRKSSPQVKTAAAYGLPGSAADADEAMLLRDANQLKTAVTDGLIDRVVLDHAAGGTGTGFDAGLFPYFADIPCVVLAGGLSAANVSQTVQTALAAGVKVLGVDFNSGVETAPGEKSAEKMSQAFEALAGRQSLEKE